MITVDTCSKHYGHQTVLDAVSFTVSPGSRAAVLGGNGAGKTTLLYILAALTSPTSGAVLIDNHSVVQCPHVTRRLVGLLTHQPGLYSDLTARENLLFFSRLYGLKEPRRSDELLEFVGLARHAQRRVREFSRGMLQRLAVAKAVLHRPAVLLLDEPLTGLDANARHILIDLLNQPQQRETTVLFTTHHIEFALKQAHRVLVLKDRTLKMDTPAGHLSAQELNAVLETPL